MRAKRIGQGRPRRGTTEYARVFLVFFEEIARANGIEDPRQRAEDVLGIMWGTPVDPDTAQNAVELLRADELPDDEDLG